jgi:hypothetical protein
LGVNNFVSFPVVASGASGPQASIDLFSAVPSSGLDSSLTFLCTGVFADVISVQGSTDGSDWSALCQFDGGDMGIHTGLQSPQAVVGSVVRYLRIFVSGVITSDVQISVAAEQNCAAGAGGQTQLTIIDQFGTTPVINSDGFSLQVDEEKYIDFSKFGATLTTYLSAIGEIGAAPLPGGLSVWATSTEGDNTGSGTLLGLVEFPTGGTIVSPTVVLTVPGPFTYGGPTARKIVVVANVNLSVFAVSENLQISSSIDFVSDAAWAANNQYVQLFFGGTAQSVGVIDPPTAITGTLGQTVYDPGPASDNHVTLDTTGSLVNPGGTVNMKIAIGTVTAVPVTIDSITITFSKFPPAPSNFDGVDATTVIANPGGKKFIVLTSFAGATGAEFPATSVPLSYFGAFFTMKG